MTIHHAKFRHVGCPLVLNYLWFEPRIDLSRWNEIMWLSESWEGLWLMINVVIIRAYRRSYSLLSRR